MKLLMQAEFGYIIFEPATKLYLVERKRTKGTWLSLWVSHPQGAGVIRTRKGATQLAQQLIVNMNVGAKLVVAHAVELDGDVILARLDSFLAS